jgi:O-antigen/teichoic acid export membrane protein
VSVTRNLSTRYLAIVAEMAVGLLVLPFNVAHLGKAAYGLWVLTTSITAYFSVLDLGYSGALVKFVAQYRAKRDFRGLNEILSTTFHLFVIFGVVTYLVAIVIAVFLDNVLTIAPEQLHVARVVLLVTSIHFALGTACSVFGAVINGFERYDINNITGTISSVLVAVVNVVVLSLGYGLVELVIATTVVKVLTYAVYRANAYRVYRGLDLRPANFRRHRLREVTSFSVFMLLIDWANKMNYSIDTIVIGVMLGTTAVAVWTIGQRLAEVTQRLTNQLNDILFPNIVNHSESSRLERLQNIFVVGTRLSLATVVPIGTALILMGAPLVQAWVGPDFSDSVIVLQLLSLTVIIRVGTATAQTLLKGAEGHRLVAYTNVVTAVVNLALSVALARAMGLAGVAIGTLVPITAASFFVLFPAGCRRVELPLGRAFADAVWPAVWPAAAMAAYIAVTRPYVPISLVPVLLNMAVAAGVYVVTFFAFASNSKERHFYLSKAFEAVPLTRTLLAGVTGHA